MNEADMRQVLAALDDAIEKIKGCLHNDQCGPDSEQCLAQKQYSARALVLKVVP
jgi:hypothetical protein